MTYIRSLRLTGEMTATHAGELSGYVRDAGIVAVETIPVLAFLSLRVSKSVLDPADILPHSRGCRASGCAGIRQVV